METLATAEFKEKNELQVDSDEDESKKNVRVSESILNIWNLWKSTDDQNEKESRLEAFDELKECGKRLTLPHMGLSMVPNIFPYTLKELNVSFNKLTQIPCNLPETLETLNINDNQVSIIPEKLPPSLQKLFITNNKITDVPATLPDSITHLNLSHNGITTLPHKLPKSLKILKVCDNKLFYVPENLPESIEELEIRTNKLTNLPNNLPKSLRKIFADENEITKLPETLPKMLKEIHIHYNKLTSLPVRLPESLEKLYMSHNNLSKPKFDSESIIELDLENNGIERIFEEYFHLPKLEKLFLSENKLVSLPKNLPQTLVWLHAYCNNLTVIPNLPKTLTSLELDENCITNFPKNLPPKLEILTLHQNKISEVPTELPLTLSNLGLGHNLITEIPLSIETITNCSINLEGNSLNENSIEYLRQLVRSTKRDDIYFDGSYDYYVNYVETRPLIEEITYWLNAELINPYWNTISEEINSRSFARLLYRIRNTSNFEVQGVKEDISNWLCYLGEENDIKQKLRELVFSVSNTVFESCNHRVVWSLNQLKILITISEVESGKYDNKVEALIKIGRGMYRLNVLDQISRKMVQKLEDVDEIEIYLEYQNRLRDLCYLPITTSKMNEHNEFVLSDRDIKRAIKQINNKEKTEFINYFLIDWQPWKEVLKRWNYEKFVKSETNIKNEELFKEHLDKRKQEYLFETNMSHMSLDVEVQLGAQVQHNIEKDIWWKLSNEFLESMQLNLKTLI